MSLHCPVGTVNVFIAVTWTVQTRFSSTNLGYERLVEGLNHHALALDTLTFSVVAIAFDFIHLSSHPTLLHLSTTGAEARLSP